MRPRAISAPSSTSLSITARLASPSQSPFFGLSRRIFLPPKNGRSDRKEPSSSTLYVISSPCFRPI